MKFKVTWPNGNVTDEVSETTSPEGYAMERWGRSLDGVSLLDIKIEPAEAEDGVEEGLENPEKGELPIDPEQFDPE